MKTFRNIYRTMAGSLLAILLVIACSKSTNDPNSPGATLQKLSVAASATTVQEGTEVTFTTTAGDKSVAADIYIDKVKITGNKHTFAKPGTYTVVAKRQGYADSDAVIVSVTATPQVMITASATTVQEGTEVTFTTQVDGKDVDAQIYIDDDKITGKKHTFAAVGTFKVIAKKQGYVDSDPLTVTVTATPTLTLTASATTVREGTEVTFTVKSADEAVTADIYIDGTKITGHKHTFAAPGVYTVVAKKQGYTDSEALTITVTPTPKLTLTASATTVREGTQVTFTTKSGEENVTADIYVNGTRISGNKHTFATPGTYSVVAKQTGYVDSDPVTITVTATPKLMLTASATHVDEGTEVTFTTRAANQNVTADIYVNNTKINGNKHNFNTAGTYTVVAKKQNHIDSDPLTITVVYVPKKVGRLDVGPAKIAEYTPTYGSGFNRVAMSNTHIYTYSGNTQQFKRLSLETNTWETLTGGEHLAFTGIGGPLVYMGNAARLYDVIVYYAQKSNVYFTPESGVQPPLEPNAWAPEDIPSGYGGGERAAAERGEDLYLVGNERVEANGKNIDRYNVYLKTWERVGQLPDAISGAQTIIHQNKMYIMGRLYNGSVSPRRGFYIFDTQSKTTRKVALHPSMTSDNFIGARYGGKMVVVNNYLLYLDYNNNGFFVYDISADKWLDNKINLPTGVFEDWRFVHLLSPTPGYVFMTGTMNGDFKLYTVHLSVVME